MIGFTMYEIVAGVGFVLRLMVDKQHQRRGYGKATLQGVIRCLRLDPRVEIVATSHCHENQVASGLFASVGFVKWDIGWASEHKTETFLRLSN